MALKNEVKKLREELDAIRAKVDNNDALINGISGMTEEEIRERIVELLIKDGMDEETARYRLDNDFEQLYAEMKEKHGRRGNNGVDT